MLLELISSGPVPALLLILVLAMALHIIRQNKTFNRRVVMAAHLKQKELELIRRLNRPLPEEYNVINKYVDSLSIEDIKKAIESIELYDDDTEFKIIP